MTPEQARQQAESLASNFQILSQAVFNLSEHAIGVSGSIECDGEVTEYQAERLQRLTRQFVEFGPKTDFDAEVNLRTGEIEFLPTFDCGPRIDLDGK